MTNDERPTAGKAAGHGCVAVLWLLLAVAILLGAPLFANVIAPLDQVGQNDNQVQQIGDGR